LLAVVYLPLCIHFKYLAPHFTNNFECIFARDSRSTSSRKSKGENKTKNNEKKIRKTNDVFVIFMGEEKSTIRKQTRCPQGVNATSSAHCVSLNYAQRKQTPEKPRKSSRCEK